ncbi:STAS domain-containing protein [Azospirillum halopraeferens]|uniref:STAS domain-containing protein n=1 Tax=Azospirillum halopraeferens TaxID=34010 RepID=UPI00048F9DEE|nr:STAS domain-containing protein [Azospirillum halopraeferens]
MSLIGWSEEDGRVCLGLPGDLDLPMAQPLADSLRAAFARDGAVVVRAGAVERLSTACVQALMVASRHAGEQGRVFVVEHPSEVMAETCGDLGLADWLKQWSVA